jgi:uncharacterized membrane protein
MKQNSIYSTKSQIIVSSILGAFLIFAGIGHLSFMRTAFLAQVPNWVPMEPKLVVLLSGVVEIILGASLIFTTKQRAKIGWIIALYLVAIFPGNIAQLVNRKYAFGLNSDLLLWLRLPLQPLLIIAVLWSSTAYESWRTKKKIQ